VDLRIFTEPQEGASYDDQLRVARATEDLGFDAFFRSDHFLAMGGDGLPGPTDSWVTLGGLARETSRIRLGTLVSSVTFRHPGMLAVQVAQVDAMSGGRVELGLGAGWFTREHATLGVPFPPVGERFDRLAEQLEVLDRWWTTPPGATFDFHGEHSRLEGCPALPRPVQDRPPLIMGGKGPRRTPSLAARYADEFNGVFTSVEETEQVFERVRAACRDAGREPSSMTWSVAVTIMCGADDGEVARRARAAGREPGSYGGGDVAGTPDQVVERLGRYAELGVTRVYLQVLDLHDLDHLELIAARVAPQLA
jgi:F420-dependent oxidoreductase-like protein